MRAALFVMLITTPAGDAVPGDVGHVTKPTAISRNHVYEVSTHCCAGERGPKKFELAGLERQFGKRCKLTSPQSCDIVAAHFTRRVYEEEEHPWPL